jgi:copper oxidase (laccase) domain-containing protein
MNVLSSGVAALRTSKSGVVKNITQCMLESMKKEFNSSPLDIEVLIGPGIRVCHFSIIADIDNEFPGFAKSTRDEKTYIDLPKIIKYQLAEAGVVSNHIDECNLCTFCLENKYFSHRRDQVSPLETMLCYLSIE